MSEALPLYFLDLCSNRAATRVNLLKGLEMHQRRNAVISSSFASSGNLRKTISPPSHGGGHEFESCRVLSEKRQFSA